MREQFAWRHRVGTLAQTIALAATSAIVLASACLLAAVHVHDRYYVNHVSGHWMTLARYVHDGTVYPPLFDGSHTFGTFYFPLPFLAHGAVSLVTGEYLVSGKLTAYATAIALFGFLFLLLRRVGCSKVVSLALVSAVLVTPAGYLAAVSIRGDALAVVFQLGALLVVTRGISRRTMLVAAVLCALGLASKSTAVWAPAAILVWAAVRDRRAAVEFAAAFVGLTAVLFGLVDLVSGGRFWENISTFALSQPTDPGATPLSGASTLVHLNFLDRDGIWLLFPFALLAGTLSLRRRRLSLFQIALVIEMLILVVVLRDVGADYNHLLDMSVLTALVVGELWASPDFRARVALADRFDDAGAGHRRGNGVLRHDPPRSRPRRADGDRYEVGRDLRDPSLAGDDRSRRRDPLGGSVAPDPRRAHPRHRPFDAVAAREASQSLDRRPAQAHRRQGIRRRGADPTAPARLVSRERQLRRHDQRGDRAQLPARAGRADGQPDLLRLRPRADARSTLGSARDRLLLPADCDRPLRIQVGHVAGTPIERPFDRVGRATSREPVPERGHDGRAMPLEPLRNLRQPARVQTEQRVRAVRDRHRPLGVVAQREARHAERRRLLLDAAGVGQRPRRRRPRATRKAR